MSELSRDELCVANLLWLGSFGRAQQGISLAVPTLDDHNYLIQSPFRAFIDSMEIPLSLEFINMWLNTV